MRFILSFVFVAVSFLSGSAHALTEEGTSKISCRQAKQDARLAADGQCLALDTRTRNARYGECERRRKEYRVKLYYTCQGSNLASDFDSYH